MGNIRRSPAAEGVLLKKRKNEAYRNISVSIRMEVVPLCFTGVCMLGSTSIGAESSSGNDIFPPQEPFATKYG